MKFLIEASGYEFECNFTRYRLQTDESWREIKNPLNPEIPLFTLDDKVQGTDRQFENLEKTRPYLSLSQIILNGKSYPVSSEPNRDYVVIQNIQDLQRVWIKPKVYRVGPARRFTKKELRDAIMSVIPARNCTLILTLEGYFQAVDADAIEPSDAVAVYHPLVMTGLEEVRQKVSLDEMYGRFMGKWKEHLHSGDIAINASGITSEMIMDLRADND